MSSYHVLVVDDNHEIRRMVTASIKTLSADIDVLDVPSAEEALFISASLPLDLIVLDFRLPGMSGLEMVDRLRKRKPGLKIILVTGIEDPTARQHVVEAGVFAYFFKPIEIALFLDSVKRALWPEQVAEIHPDSIANISARPGGSTAPGVSTQPAVVVAPPPGTASNISKGPPVVTAPPTGREPGASVAPAPTKVLDERKKPAVIQLSSPPAVPFAKEKSPTPAVRFQPTIDERLNALKQQLKAALVLLLAESGQIAEVAGDTSPITYNAALLPSLVEAFKASLKVSDALGSAAVESLLSYTSGRQHVYLTSVDPTHALLVVTQGYVEPDKLGLIDRAIHLATQDLQTILERQREAENARRVEAEARQAQLPDDVIVDQETLDLIENMFSKAPKKGGKEKADGYWETLEQSGALDRQGGEDVLSYSQAREMGLAPEPDNEP